MLEWLNSPVVTVDTVPTSVAEVLGFLTGVWCVFLVVRQSALNWPVGIINNVMWALVFTTAGLYADGVLQLIYIGLAIFGWISWVYVKRSTTNNIATKLTITKMSPVYWSAIVIAAVLATSVVMWVLVTFTTSTVPFFDAVTTSVSLLAVFAQARKKLEAWYLWIFVDIIYIPLYVHKGLWLTAICYIIFLILCIVGLRTWRKDYQQLENQSRALKETVG